MKNISEVLDPKLVEAHKPKIGAGHLMGWLRLGGKEAAQVFQPTPESIQLQEDMGVFGNATPGETYMQKNPELKHSRGLPQQPQGKQLRPEMQMEM